MQRIAVGLASVIALASIGAAQAAAPAPVAVWSWTGPYIGLNIGYSWGYASNSETLTNGNGFVLFTDSGSPHMDGVIGGGQIGYNWQVSNWVWGLEADIQGSGQKGPTRDFVCPAGICTSLVTSGEGVPVFGPALTGSFEQKLNWFDTLRARAGLLVTPTVLAYVTGGLAYGEIESNLVLATPTTAAAFSQSATHAGWTVGVGIEGRIVGNWTAKVEYLYIDLGSISNAFTTTIPAFGGGFIGVASSTNKVTDNIVRVGVNYKF
jgi:outer membrane immunogenic protein